MVIKEQLLLEHSKANAQFITNFIGHNPNRVEELVNCFLSQEYRVSQRSAMVISRIGDNHPELLTPHIDKLVNTYLDNSQKDSVIRSIVRFFQFYELPEQHQGIVLDRSYNLMSDSDQAIAIRAFAMGVIYKISKPYKELCDELKLVLEDLYIENATGLENRRKNIMKLL